ncbi:hypothetical protein [Guptibacillus algicola]|uniref:hypothetical protein n=1 Tax=Guptibacillus algicola TaxID=225844 RepID=UPI001CD22B72|nr:hypothetical protein [Alkalihalobacillus algicola]MCA0987330.1 hypothetical protein [Alkalihalobacillus algicola]
MKLRSNRLGSVLTKFLWADIVLTSILMINVFIAQVVGVGDSFINYDAVVALVLGVNVLIYTIIYLVWLHKVHNDLREMDSSYPITPGGALARVMVPFYNLYGLWNVYATMATHFKESASSHEAGKKLAIYTPIYYFLYLITGFMNSYISFQSDYDPFSFIWLLTYIGDAALVISYILIIKVVTTGLMNLSEQYMKSDNEDQASSSF